MAFIPPSPDCAGLIARARMEYACDNARLVVRIWCGQDLPFPVEGGAAVAELVIGYDGNI